MTFTEPDCWAGGSIDALMFFSKESASNATEISSMIWSSSDLEGPYTDRSRPPELQKVYDFCDFGQDGFHSLVGVLTTYDGFRCPFTQTTVVDDEGLWIYAGPTMGGLPRSWEVGAYPFADGKPTRWLSPLIQQLRNLSLHVHKRFPLRAATYGWLTLIDVDIVTEALLGIVPDERWAGISIWNGHESIYYPPTHHDAPIRPR